MRTLRLFLMSMLLLIWIDASGQVIQKVVDIPTRSGVTERVLLIVPAEPKVTLILFPGGHGGLQIFPNGSMKWGESNFLVRTRQLFADAGFAIAIIDAPSDRQSPPFLQGFRQKPDHVADIRAVISALRASIKAPIWLVGTSRGTQSVAYLATELGGSEGPDGIVLSSTILRDDKGRAVLAMPLNKIKVPVLVVHHEQDECEHCPVSLVPELMAKLGNSVKSQLLTFKGGDNKGDPCESMAYHGFNGLERDVVSQMTAWIAAK